MVGKCVEVISCGTERVLAELHTIPCRPKDKYASKFLGYYMNSEAYHRPLLPLIQGTKVKSISKHALQDSDMYIPMSGVEQGKIGDYFSQLDLLIDLQQNEVDRLTCMQQSNG